ncbi:MAG TPA: hypothetical protein VJU87_10260, partial [Gemmatimonadaceae bacterium]|nr:hypothetical protein [Gemmatimonadaceae bacterium]
MTTAHRAARSNVPPQMTEADQLRDPTFYIAHRDLIPESLAHLPPKAIPGTLAVLGLFHGAAMASLRSAHQRADEIAAASGPVDYAAVEQRLARLAREDAHDRYEEEVVRAIISTARRGPLTGSSPWTMARDHRRAVDFATPHLRGQWPLLARFVPDQVLTMFAPDWRSHPAHLADVVSHSEELRKLAPAAVAAFALRLAAELPPGQQPAAPYLDPAAQRLVQGLATVIAPQGVVDWWSGVRIGYDNWFISGATHVMSITMTSLDAEAEQREEALPVSRTIERLRE